MAFSPTNQPARQGQSAPAESDSKGKRRSKLLGGVNGRAVGEAVLVSALAAILAFWQGDVLSAKIDMFLDDAKLWPADGLIAVVLAGYLALTKRVKPINKIRFVPALGVYGFNAIYGARVAAGLATP